MTSTDSLPQRSWVRLSLVLIALGGAFIGQYFLSVQDAPARAAVGWTLAAVSFVLLYGVARDTRTMPAALQTDFSPRTGWLLLCGVFLIGVFFKFYKLSELPPGLNHDAAWEGQYALGIVKGQLPYTPYISAAWGRETLTFYFRAVAVWLLGNVRLAVYGPSVIAGILTLPIIYGWMRNLFGNSVALLSTLLFGVSGWSLIFSRVGWRSDYQPLFTALTCYFFIRAMRTRSLLHFGLAGVALAATMNTYNAARVFPVVFALWLPIFMLESWHWRGFLKRYGYGIVMMGVTFTVAIFPLAWYAVHNWTKFQGRATFLVGSGSYWVNAKKSALMFNYFANGDDFFTNTPGLEYFAAIFFVFGFLWCLLRLRDERAQFVLIGLITGMVPGFVSDPNMNRNIGSMPFVFAMAGLGVFFFARELARLLPQRKGMAGALFAAAIGIGSAVATYAQFLGPHHRTIWGFYPETTVVGEFMASLDPRYRIWVGGANFPRDTLIYLNYREGDVFEMNFNWEENISDLIKGTPIHYAGEGLAFILATEGAGPVVLADLKGKFPKHEIVDLRYPKDSGHVFAQALLVAPDDDSASVDQSRPVRPESMPTVPQAKQGELSEPRGVALLSNGSVVVCDFGHNRMQVFDKSLQFSFTFGEAGVGPGQFRQPAGVAVGVEDEIYVADTWNQRIQVFGPDGTFRRQWLSGFFSPRGITVNSQGEVYVADSGNNRVMHFTSSGDKLNEWNGSENAGKFIEPIGIAVDASGRVYVADNGNARLQMFDADGSPAGSFRVTGWAREAYSEPHIAIDAKGWIWVTVPIEHQVRAYDKQGVLKMLLSGTHAKPDPFGMPIGIAYDAVTQTFVLSEVNNRIFRLNPPSEP